LFLLKFLVRFYAVKNFIALPLGPHEVIVAPFLVVAHTPPKSCFESRTHKNRIIATTYVILIRREACVGEFDVITVRTVNFHQKLPVVSLLQLKKLLLVFGVGQILGELLDLGSQSF